MFSFPSALSLCSNVFRRWLETSNNATNLKFLSLRKFCFFYMLPIIFCKRTDKFCPGVFPTLPIAPKNDSYTRFFFLTNYIICSLSISRKLSANVCKVKKRKKRHVFPALYPFIYCNMKMSFTFFNDILWSNWDDDESCEK